MSYETRAYDNQWGDPVVVLVATGTHDVSRLTNLLAGNRMALCEHLSLSRQILKQIRRHNGGRVALRVLAAHGGPDLLHDADTPETTVSPERIRQAIGDPGSIVPRRIDAEGEPVESVPQWSARAVLHVLGQSDREAVNA